jgi:hypothetical protein
MIMCMHLLRYFFYSWRYPESAGLGLLKMGMGIQRRRKLLAVHWQSHLQQSCEVQQAWAREAGCRAKDRDRDPQLVVLGAGYLFDLDLGALSKIFPRILLVDGNPLAKPIWMKIKRAYSGQSVIDCQISEISGVLVGWRTRLAAALRSLPGTPASWPATLQAIKEIDTSCLKDSLGLPAGNKASAIISLNILSQIPLLWQDCIERILVKQYGKRFVNDHQREWLEHFYPSAKMLVAQHLSSIAAFAPNDILLLTDLEYAYYTTAPRFRANEFAEPPFIWKRDNQSPANGSWQTNPSGNADAEARSCHVMSALYGIDLENENARSSLVPGYTSTALPSWLWHIEPLGTEANKRGIIHRVGAFLFKKT